MARLIWLMGASGAGKDSLLNALRKQPVENVMVAHRYITRPADDMGGENHLALTEAEFLRRREKGLFVIDWQAHHLHYGIGIEVDVWLARGINVIVNGSRGHLPLAMSRYGTQLLPVCLHVSADALAQRLRQRGRESESEIQQRLQRVCEPPPVECHWLNNDGPLEETVSALQDLLEDTLCA